MASPLPTTEGFAPFVAPGATKPCQTWYLLIGSLSSPLTPLVALHGGPGACHEYLLPLQDLYTAYGTPVILYDQLGNGKSTRLREKAGDESFWTESLFCAELDNLLDHFGLHARTFDLYGHCWGGMLASKYAASDPKGLRKLVLAGAPASVELVLRGSNALREGLPGDVQEVLNRCEAANEMETEEYEAACMVFYKKHLCRMEPWPEEVGVAMGHLKEDPTVYRTMWVYFRLFVRERQERKRRIAPSYDLPPPYLG